MHVDYSKHFQKQLRKIPKGVQDRFWERLTLLLEDSQNPLLHDHQLSGAYALCRSINITGDVRAIYAVDGEVIRFLAIGTHSELYE